MLTDDDLTRQLGAAFEDATRDTTYDGAAPRVRSRPAWVAPGWVALPAAGAVAAAVLVMGSTGDAPSSPAPDAAPDVTTAAPSPTPSAEDTVTDSFTLAGMTFTYERGADEASIDDQFLRVYDPGQLPGWAQPVELESGASAKVWVGQDPATGDVSMFVASPERWGGALAGLASPTLSVEQMTELARTGTLS